MLSSQISVITLTSAMSFDRNDRHNENEIGVVENNPVMSVVFLNEPSGALTRQEFVQEGLNLESRLI